MHILTTIREFLKRHRTHVYEFEVDLSIRKMGRITIIETSPAKARETAIERVSMYNSDLHTVEFNLNLVSTKDKTSMAVGYAKAGNGPDPAAGR